MKRDIYFHPRPMAREEIVLNLDKISALFKTHDVSVAFLFGSILQGETPNDLDIGVFISNKKRPSLELYTDLYLSLCSILHADNIDIAILNDTGPAFRFEVISKGYPIY